MTASLPPTRRARLAFALLIGLACGGVVLVFGRASTSLSIDFGVSRRGAQALLQHLNPYTEVGPGRRYPFPFPLLYPMPAVLLQLPLAWLSDRVAQAVFIAASAAAAAYGLTRCAWHPALAFTSSPFLVTLSLTQWSLAVVASATVVPLAWVVAVKPNIGLVVAATWTSRRQWVIGAVGSAALIAASFAVAPTWVADWRAAVATAQYARPPIAGPGGALLFVLAMTRWRRPEGRLLAALAVVPHTPAHYDALLLFLVPATMSEALTLSALTWAADFADAMLRPTTPGDHFDADAAVRAAVILALLYLPCLIMVLRRPNEGSAPECVERVARAVSDRVPRRFPFRRHRVAADGDSLDARSTTTTTRPAPRA